MAQRFTNLLVAATLIAVLFVAFQINKVTETMEQTEVPQTITFGGVTTPRLTWDEPLEEWKARQLEAYEAFKDAQGE